MLAREIPREPHDEAMRLGGVLRHDPDDGRHIDMLMLVVPAVVVGHHGDRRVAKLRLAGELRLRHVGHADHVAAPAPV
jgi:hypothetical protein